jgi:hypothetical protein
MISDPKLLQITRSRSRFKNERIIAKKCHSLFFIEDRVFGHEHERFWLLVPSR